MPAVGLRAEYFALENRVSRLSEIDFERAPDATGAIEALDISKSHDPFWADGPEDYFAARYSGGFEIAEAGSYTLYLTSDDGSALMIDGQSVIDNDGKHGARELSVTLDLEAGVHDLGLLYFEYTGTQTLQLEWQGPDTGGARTVMGAETLHHEVVEEPEQTQEPGSEVVPDKGEGMDMELDAQDTEALEDFKKKTSQPNWKRCAQASRKALQ